MVTNRYVAWIMEWFECPEETPFGLANLVGDRFDGTRGRSVIRTTPVALSQEHLEQALRIVRDSGKGLPRRLEVAIERWVRSKEPGDPADRLIDLRIALEAAFLECYKPGVKGRIGTRGSWYLGNSEEARQQIAKQLTDAYGEASSVVHGTPSGDARKARAVLHHAQELSRRAILRMMEESEPPDWTRIVGTGAAM